MLLFALDGDAEVVDSLFLGVSSDEIVNTKQYNLHLYIYLIISAHIDV